ncbi:MAG: ATP-grasp domain-containing protein [Ignavibacteria bacterium]|jgi:hypothetical protein
MKILITDADSRKSFDVINILKSSYNFELILCSKKDYKFKLPLIYGQRVYRLRNICYNDFESDFSLILSDFPDEDIVYFPMGEKSTINFYEYIKKGKCKNLKYLLPDKTWFHLTRNKSEFQKYCENHNFPVPKSFTKETIDNGNTKFTPLIIKPNIGEGSVGIKQIDSAEKLVVIDDINLDEYIIQEKIVSNRKVSGAFFLCENGDVVNSYTHERLRTFPVSGGVTVYSKSTINSDIIEIGCRVLKAMKWNGFAMIEFLYDNIKEEWKIIELNPRIWGSIMLSQFIGTEFLNDYIKLCLDDTVNKGKKIKEGYIRWLYPFDLINLLTRQIKLCEFVRFNLHTTCYINMSYSNFFRTFLYLLYFSINIDSLKRFLKKIFG